jgi:hypothetical protein
MRKKQRFWVFIIIEGSMKCKRQPILLAGKPDAISELWEVRMPMALWRKLCQTAQSRGTSFSWISRFCAFALAERNRLSWRRKFLELRDIDLQEYSAGNHHRHMVCLYGEDARMLRLAALQWGISVSALIRLSLRFYLRYFDMDVHSKRYVSDACLFWKGIKRWIAIPLTAENHLSLPTQRTFTFQSFPPERRWRYP